MPLVSTPGPYKRVNAVSWGSCQTEPTKLHVMCACIDMQILYPLFYEPPHDMNMEKSLSAYL